MLSHWSAMFLFCSKRSSFSCVRQVDLCFTLSCDFLMRVKAELLMNKRIENSTCDVISGLNFNRVALFLCKFKCIYFGINASLWISQYYILNIKYGDTSFVTFLLFLFVYVFVINHACCAIQVKHV